MEIEFKIVANKSGYVEEIYVDGVLQANAAYVRTETGSKLVNENGCIDDQCHDVDDLGGIADEFSTFLGLTLMQHCEERGYDRET